MHYIIFYSYVTDTDLKILNNFYFSEEAKPSTGCPRANGYYPHIDPSQCNKFLSCDDGKYKEISCPPGE